MNLTIMVVAGLLTGTSFLDNLDGNQNEGAGGTTPPVLASTPARMDAAVDRRSNRCREAEPTAWDIKLALDDEPGERLVLDGRVLGTNRAPLPGVKVYVFHTDAGGYYSENRGMDNTHPRLCGILRTDEMGRYRVSTIKPARYATGGPAPHVHYEVTPAGQKTESFLLTFDSPVQGGAARRGQTWDSSRPLERDLGGVWHCTRDLWVR